MDNPTIFIQTPSKLGENGTNPINNRYLIQDRKPGRGKHADVFFVATPQHGTNFAVKRQPIKSPLNQQDKAYRELRIMKELQKLDCDNFITIKEWFKIRPDNEFQEKEEQYMHFVLECAERTLSDALREPLPLMHFKCIIFQIVYALHLAQQNLEFVHYDLHFGNILLSPMAEGRCRAYTLDEKKWWYITDHRVTIIDFGLSRAKLPSGEIIYNFANSFSERFDNETDIQVIGQQLKKVSISDWGTEEEIQRSLISDFKKKMNKSGVSLSELLQHNFFSSLSTPRDSSAIIEKRITPHKTEKENMTQSLINQMESIIISPEGKKSKGELGSISRKVIKPIPVLSPSPVRRKPLHYRRKRTE